jgi:ABC-type sugar transport system substrate-binding protein
VLPKRPFARGAGAVTAVDRRTSLSRRIVVSLITKGQEFQELQAADAARTALRLGLDVEVLFAGNDPLVQAQQLSRLVHASGEERPAAIVTETVVGEALESIALSAVGAGIAWVLVNRKVAYVDALRRQHPELAVFMVSSDQEEIGRIQARQLRALLPKGGSVLYVQGPADTSAAQDRLSGAQEGLRGSAVQIAVVNGNWTEASAEKAVACWLDLAKARGSRIDVVGAQNDSMAVGARRAILARGGAATLRFTGCDGLAEGGRRLVDEGVLAATIVSPSNTGPALERLFEWMKTGYVPPRDVLLEPHSYPDEALIRP